MRHLPDRLAVLAADQAGVVSRRQVLAAGCAPSELRSLMRHRLLTRLHPGVYVDHSGTPSWQQRAWAAVLYAAPAALHGPSVLAHHGVGERAGDVHVTVEGGRALNAPAGVVTHRTRSLRDRLDRVPGIPRTRLEEAVLDVAAEARDDLAVVAVLAEAVGSRRVTVRRLAETLAVRPRIARRRLLGEVLDDLALGACSVIERAYPADVERAHGLPTARRQVRASSRGTIYRDVEYTAQGVVVELDGRAGHTSVADRDRDLDRDLDAAVGGRVTVRLGYGQVLGRPCATADRIHRLLAGRGWTGPAHPCPRCTSTRGIGAHHEHRSHA